MIPFCNIQVCLCEPIYLAYKFQCLKEGPILLKALGRGICDLWTHFFFMLKFVISGKGGLKLL